MAEETFADLGRVEAISKLYEGTPYKPFQSSRFETSGKSFVTNHSRTYIEGIDFDLTYFPLKHLGYKCVIGVTGELYADFSHPRTMDVRLGTINKKDASSRCIFFVYDEEAVGTVRLRRRCAAYRRHRLYREAQCSRGILRHAEMIYSYAPWRNASSNLSPA